MSPSPIIQNFVGTFLTVTTCTCQAKSEKRDSFCSLELAIPPGNTPSLQSCLAEYFRPKKVVWSCANCLKKEIPATQKTSIDFIPKCLLIQFVRWSQEKNEKGDVITSKNNANIIFTEGVDFTYVLTEENILANNPNMTLRGVLEHDGSKSGGHYTNLHLTADQLYGTDNGAVSIGKTHQSRYAYMLMYACSSSGIPYSTAPIGLANPRRKNRCYFNAALQLLSCGPSLISGFMIPPGGILTRDMDEQSYHSYKPGWSCEGGWVSVRWACFFRAPCH